jgi:hypothetical protein
MFKVTNLSTKVDATWIKQCFKLIVNNVVTIGLTILLLQTFTFATIVLQIIRENEKKWYKIFYKYKLTWLSKKLQLDIKKPKSKKKMDYFKAKLYNKGNF